MDGYIHVGRVYLFDVIFIIYSDHGDIVVSISISGIRKMYYQYFTIDETSLVTAKQWISPLSEQKYLIKNEFLPILFIKEKQHYHDDYHYYNHRVKYQIHTLIITIKLQSNMILKLGIIIVNTMMMMIMQDPVSANISHTTRDDFTSSRDKERSSRSSGDSRSSSIGSSSRKHRDIIDISLCLRTAGVDFVLLIYRNKYDDVFDNHHHHHDGGENTVKDLLLVSDVKYLESQLYGYIDLLLIHDNNNNNNYYYYYSKKNITEANCELNRYHHHHHQLSSLSSERRKGGRGGHETVESVSTATAHDDDDDDDDDDMKSTASERVLPIVALSGKDKIEVISIRRRNLTSTISTKRISFET